MGNVMGTFLGRSICPPDTDCPPLQGTSNSSHSPVNTVHLKSLGNHHACEVMMKDKAIVAIPFPQSVKPGVTYSEWHHSVHKEGTLYTLKEERVS